MSDVTDSPTFGKSWILRYREAALSRKRALLRFYWGWPRLVIISALFHSYIAWLLHRVVTNAASQFYIRKTWVWSLAPSGSDQFSPLTPANDSVNVRHARIESTAKSHDRSLVCRNTLRYVSTFSFLYQGVETLIFWHLEVVMLIMLGWIVVGLLR